MSADQSPRAGDGKLPLTERLGDMRHYLNEAHGFAAMSPRGRDCIGIVLDLLDEMEPEVTALAAAPAAAPAWQPIETAPKDGRKLILAYVNSCGKARTVMARWLTDEEAEETDADGVGLVGGWYECIDNWEDYTEVAIHQGEPSRWMLPPTVPGFQAPGAAPRDA